MRVAAHLKRPTREHMRAACAAQSCDWTACPPIWSCSGRGLPCRRVLPPARCALTAPFHPYRRAALGHALRRFAFCCTFRGLAPPRRYLASCPWSPDFPPPLRAAVAWPTPRPMIQVSGAVYSDLLVRFVAAELSGARIQLAAFLAREFRGDLRGLRWRKFFEQRSQQLICIQCLRAAWRRGIAAHNDHNLTTRHICVLRGYFT